MRTVALLLVLAAAAPPAAADEWNTVESRARWDQLRQAIYGVSAEVAKTDHLATLTAPPTAEDAALVPVTIGAAPDARALDLVIDQNPAPLAARVKFGPAGDPRRMTLRVRVDGFTKMHAVTTAADGRLAQTAVFVQAAGGCSAPVADGDALASAGIGEMRLKLGSDASLGEAPMATLMIRHPNYSGMQMSKATHAYVPARFIKSISVRRAGTIVFEMASDISLSTNPVIGFLYKRESQGPFVVTVADSSGATWTRQFSIPPSTN